MPGEIPKIVKKLTFSSNIFKGLENNKGKPDGGPQTFVHYWFSIEQASSYKIKISLRHSVYAYQQIKKLTFGWVCELCDSVNESRHSEQSARYYSCCVSRDIIHCPLNNV